MVDISDIIQPMDGDGFELIAVDPVYLAEHPDARCMVWRCQVPASHCWRHVVRGIGAWLCPKHAERVRRLKGLA